MNFKKIKSKVSIIILLALVFSSFIYSAPNAIADTNKTIVITFNSAPGAATATITPLKYNKKFAYSYTFDDSLDDGYDPAFIYMNGGYSTYLGQYFGGLYFTDGTGNNVPFRAGLAWYSRNSSNYSDIHINTPSYITWDELQELSDNGWDIFNHGYTSASVTDPDYVYYVGDPGGHATGTLDYSYELTQNNAEVASHVNLKNNAGISVGAFQMSQVVLPNGDTNYTQPAFDNNYKAIYNQSNDFFINGSTTTIPDLIDTSQVISYNPYFMTRWFDYESRYLSGGEFPGALFNRVDQLAALSTGSHHYWGHSFTHQLTTSLYPNDWNGGMTFTSWKSLMDHIENTYGRFGDDSAWVAGAEEVYDYNIVKQNTVLNQSLVGNQLTIEFDTSAVPTDLRHYALSILVDSNTAISDISYGTDFTHHTANINTGLINLDWGVNTYSENDITRVESLVSTAEASLRQSDIDTATSFNNLLASTTAQTAFQARLDAIEVPLRTWLINIKGGVTNPINCTDGNGATTTKSYAPSSYNWNLFTVGKSSDTIICNSPLTNLRDTDNQASTMSLLNTVPFFGSLSGITSSDNSGIYPDTTMIDNANINSGASHPGVIKISGLEDIKTYNIKLFGGTTNNNGTTDKNTTIYTITGDTVASSSLLVLNNTSTSVDFLNVLPDSNGEITITVAPKIAAWGTGILNVVEIKENILAEPSNLSYNSPNIYTKNNIISSLSPSVTGQGISYTVAPDLPAGLSLNSSTGVISGTPTEAVGQSTYTITATNSGGSDSFDIDLTVNYAAPSGLSYTSPNSYTKDSTITPLSPTVTGEDLAYTVAPDLPAGLSLNSSTGVIFGTPTEAVGQSTYTVTATNSSGNDTFNIILTINNVVALVSNLNPVPASTPVVLPNATGSGSLDFSLSMGASGNIGTITEGGVNYLTYIDSKATFNTTNTNLSNDLIITDLDLAYDIVSFSIEPNSQNFKLKLGESIKIDTNNDGINDIEILFKDVYINRAELTIKTLDNNIKETEKITEKNDQIIEQYIFVNNLYTGVVSTEVKELQKYLNTNGFQLANSGPGAPGEETTKFGALTRAAVIKLQKANNISHQLLVILVL